MFVLPLTSLRGFPSYRFSKKSTIFITNRDLCFYVLDLLAPRRGFVVYLYAVAQTSVALRVLAALVED